MYRIKTDVHRERKTMCLDIKSPAHQTPTGTLVKMAFIRTLTQALFIMVKKKK